MRPRSTQYGLPLFLEDATGNPMGPTNFVDLYDRLQITMSTLPSTYPDRALLALRFVNGRQVSGVPDCVVDLPKRVEQATVSYNGGQSIPVESYLRRIKGLSSRSPSRKFTASDSHSYTWSLNQQDKSTMTWVCTNSQGAVVAEYASNDQAITGSKCAAVLTVEEAWSAIVLELLATLTLCRHIAISSKM
ncbi:hypothetical protein FRB99_000264 [Tulasnella sp. 403]|nr:hypothetical protein FRB99_000264 [Tulasnella sp. 403]